ncbi:MAG: hypothetical protein H8E66_08100, partial [Planctomycetes bacterium]|nr:hypothetical protein [Planctomycetota bacterium]
MSEFLFQYYPVHPTTWVYLSSLLMIGVYFKFSRFWSVRNVDLALLILLAPGLLMVHFGEQRESHEQSAEETVAVIDGGLLADAVGTEEEARFTTGDEEVSGSDEVSVAPPDANTDPDPELDGEDGTVLEAEAIGEIATAEGQRTAIEDESVEQAASLSGRAVTLIGYIWLLSVLGMFLIRLLLDPTMVRRPLLEPNLSTGGLAFIGCPLFVFFMANVINR